MQARPCGACSQPAKLACARCHVVYYCAPACQARDWSNHKGACKTPVAGASSTGSEAVTAASQAVEQTSSASSTFGLCAADCGNPAVLRCSGCLGAFYCGNACQKRVWKQHREQCKEAAEVIASFEGETIDAFDMEFASIKREADAGNENAQFNLGLCYSNGSGVAVDKAEAFKWFKRAAEAGVAEAQFNLGNSFDIGSGVAVDKTEAVKWWKRAADSGNAKAKLKG